MDYPHFVVARLWAPVEPMDRGEVYEDPLTAVLGEKKLGTVSGGGSQLSEIGEIAYAELDLELANLDDALELAKESLEKSGAPAGSEFLFKRGDVDEVIPFGKSQCLAIYLDGINLPMEVYEKADINDLADRIEKALAPDGGTIGGSWAGREETSVYIYGPDAQVAYERLKQLLGEYPLCQNARVVIHHGNPNQNPETIRMPLHMK